MKFMRFATLALSILLSISLSGCIFGGTGTDTENGVARNPERDVLKTPSQGISARVVDSLGKPISDVLLTAQDVGFRPDSTLGMALNEAKTLAGAPSSALTDSNGIVGFTFAVAGTYIVEGSRAGQTLFFDTLKILDIKIPSSVQFKVRAVRAFGGKVKLASGLHIDSGKVFIRGTGRFVKVDALGAYSLGTLPVDVGRMGIGIRFVASPTAVLVVNQTLVKDSTVKAVPTLNGLDTLKVVYTCRDAAPDSVAKLSTPVGVASSDSAVRGPVTGGASTVPPDTNRLNLALKSCDSIPVGAVVIIKPVEPAIGTMTTKKDSVSGSFLVPVSSLPRSADGPQANQVVSYNQCIYTPGSEKTTYDIKLDESPSGSDLTVSDLTEKCVKPVLP